MAQEKDESKISTLPDPELNPLLNPLLGAHMGRWAEVYFTSPPEKREQAVADLLRELSGNPQPENFSAERNEILPQRRDEEIRRLQTQDSFAPQELYLACDSCAHENPLAQRFCGECGGPLSPLPESSLQRSELPSQVSEPLGREPEGPLSLIAREYSDESRIKHGSEALRTEGPPWAELDNSPALFGTLLDEHPEPARGSYRIYIAAVLTILVVLFVYMTWRSSSAFWSGSTAPSRVPLQAPAPIASDPAPAPAPSTSTAEPNAATPNTPSIAPLTQPSPPPPSFNSQNNRRADRRAKSRNAKGRKAKARPAPRISPANAVSSPAGLNGSEELATAQKYLTGGEGEKRDSRQAATWLWKAVGKQNVNASVLLSDLYLRGDGVTKSCDQARVLLRAAARKGETNAAERLRNLRAFGCQ